MKRDIVELLREYAAGAGGERSLRDAPLLYAAADEIEHLRAENERLRGVLTVYANPGYWDVDEYDEQQRCLVWICVGDSDTDGGSRARTALEETD